MDPITIAGLGSAAVGLFGGLFGHKGAPKYDPYQYDPSAFASSDFNDIDLKSANPELYSQLQKNAAMISQAESILNSKMQGPSLSEQHQMQENLDRAGSSLSAQGLSGSPLAFGMLNNVTLNQQDQFRRSDEADRAAIMGQISGMQNQQYQNTRGAYGDIMGQMNANQARQAQLQELLAREHQQQYGSAAAQVQESNANRAALFGGMTQIGSTLATPYLNSLYPKPAPTYNISMAAPRVAMPLQPQPLMYMGDPRFTGGVS